MILNSKISFLRKIVFIINILQAVGIMEDVWTKYHIKLGKLEARRLKPLMDEIKNNQVT